MPYSEPCRAEGCDHPGHEMMGGWCVHHYTTDRGTVVGDPKVWVAHYGDWSGIAIFGEEIDALRYAVGNSMLVSPLMEWGEVPR